ncbi:MAG: hypothetical protein ACUVX9_10740 [Anaerolineae bacterium]
MLILLLFLLPVGNTLWGTILRHAQRRGSNALLVGGSNYIVAALTNLLLTALTGAWSLSLRTLAIAVAGGVAFALAFRAIATSYGRRGLGVSAAVVQLSMAVPLAISMGVWGERPGLWQVIGMMLAVVALTSLTLDRSAAASSEATVTQPIGLPPDGPQKHGVGKRMPLAVVLGAVFLLNGLAALAPKAYTELGAPGEAYPFLTCLFGSAALTFAPDWFRPPRASRTDLGYGALLGITNVACNIMAVYLLARLPAVLVMPVNTAGGLFLASLMGFVVWREPLGRWGRTGMALALVAVTLASVGRG